MARGCGYLNLFAYQIFLEYQKMETIAKVLEILLNFEWLSEFGKNWKNWPILKLDVNFHLSGMMCNPNQLKVSYVIPKYLLT